MVTCNEWVQLVRQRQRASATYSRSLHDLKRNLSHAPYQSHLPKHTCSSTYHTVRQLMCTTTYSTWHLQLQYLMSAVTYQVRGMYHTRCKRYQGMLPYHSEVGGNIMNIWISIWSQTFHYISAQGGTRYSCMWYDMFLQIEVSSIDDVISDMWWRLFWRKGTDDDQVPAAYLLHPPLLEDERCQGCGWGKIPPRTRTGRGEVRFSRRRCLRWACTLRQS